MALLHQGSYVSRVCMPRVGNRGVKVVQKIRALLKRLISLPEYDDKIEVSIPLAQILDLPLLKLNISIALVSIYINRRNIQDKVL